MRNLLEFLGKHNHWFLFVLFEIIGLVWLFRGHTYQGSVWFSSANVVAGKLYEWDSKVTAYFSLGDINEQLTARNVYLESQVKVLSDRLERPTVRCWLRSRLSRWRATDSFLPR